MQRSSSDGPPIVIIGGGITGLVAAHALHRRGAGFLLLESASRLGGKVLTERLEGFVVEGGPDSFITFKPAALDLCRSLGLEDRLQGTRGPMKSFVRRDGRLYPLPTGLTGLAPTRLRPLVTTRVISPLGKLRAGLELVIPRRRDARDESVAEFATRRFGREVYDWAIEPLLAGIHAADGEALSIRSAYPMLLEMERAGSILRRALRAAPASARNSTSPFMALRGGMAELVEALEATLPAAAVRPGTRARSLERSGGYRVVLDDGTQMEAGAVIVTAPSHAASELVRALDPDLSRQLAAIQSVSTATVSLGYRASDVAHPLDGTGYVSPRAEGGPIVACTWTSSKFADRAPAGHVLLRVFIGRAGVEDVVSAGADALVGAARREVRDTIGIEAEPVLTRVHRWPQGIPQYTVGHAERVAAIEASVARHPGLVVTGASYRGAGLPDCVEAGLAAAQAAGSYAQNGSEPR